MCFSTTFGTEPEPVVAERCRLQVFSRRLARNLILVRQVAPGIEHIRVAPKRAAGLRAVQPVEIIIAKILGAAGVQLVGDAVHVAVVLSGYRIGESVSQVGFDLLRATTLPAPLTSLSILPSPRKF